jgi:hypothetical protein
VIGVLAGSGLKTTLPRVVDGGLAIREISAGQLFSSADLDARQGQRGVFLE